MQFLPRMLAIACLGAIISGAYGILHDQITYSISPEYFTKLKFHQFQFANFGLPTPVFVSEIGFLATWWVGFFSGWFLARIAVPAWPTSVAVRRCLVGFTFIFAFAFAGGYMRVFARPPSFQRLFALAGNVLILGVTDVPAFVRVAYIHNAGYIGVLLGLMSAILYLQRLKRTDLQLTRLPVTKDDAGTSISSTST